MEKYFIVGDIHGCYDEFLELIDGVKDRKIISVGDLIDRGPYSDKVLLWFLENEDISDFVIGNHEDKFIRYLNGNNVKINHGLGLTINQLEASPNKDFIIETMTTKTFSHYKYLDNDNLVIVHACYDISKSNITSSRATLEERGVPSRSRALYGLVGGRKDDMGYPVRLDWSEGYSGHPVVCHGHVPVDDVYINNNVYNLDTGCVFGGKLTGMFYPEMNFKQVTAKQTYSERIRLNK